MNVKEYYLMTAENYNIYTAYTVLKNYFLTKPKDHIVIQTCIEGGGGGDKGLTRRPINSLT